MAADSPDTSPAKTRRDCLTCTSRWRAEIEARLARGDSARGISTWLEAEHGERIRHDALGRHWKAHRAGAPEPAPKPPPPPARVATVTPLHPGKTRQQARHAPQRPDSRPATPEPATEVHVWKPDLSGLDELALELFQTLQSVGRSVRANPDEVSFPQSTLLAGLGRELGKLVQIRNMVTTGGKPGGANQLTPADGLKALLGNSPPPAIEGDEPDGAEDEDEYMRPAPRWANGEPDGEPDRQVVEAPVEEAPPPPPQPAPAPRAPDPAMAGAEAPRRQFIWQPPRR